MWSIEGRKQEWRAVGKPEPLPLVPGTPALLCSPRLNPDFQGPCLHRTHYGLSYEQTGLHEHFGARAPSWLLLPEHPGDSRSAHRTALHSPWKQLGVIPREKSVFTLKAWRDSSHILADFVVVFSGRSKREGGGNGSVWPFKKLAEPLKGTRGLSQGNGSSSKDRLEQESQVKESWEASLSANSFILFLPGEEETNGRKTQPAAESYLLSQDTSLLWSLVKLGGGGVLLLTNWYVSSIILTDILYSFQSYPSLFHHHPHLLQVPALTTLVPIQCLCKWAASTSQKGTQQGSQVIYFQGNMLLPREILLCLAFVIWSHKCSSVSALTEHRLASVYPRPIIWLWSCFLGNWWPLLSSGNANSYLGYWILLGFVFSILQGLASATIVTHICSSVSTHPPIMIFIYLF